MNQPVMLTRLTHIMLAFVALLACACRVGAAESGPSNSVGFWKLDVGRGFTQVSFPLLPADKSVDNVLGDQLTGGLAAEQSDQVQRWNAATGQFQVCWYNLSTSAWEGDFDRFSEAESYWIYVQPTHPETQTIVTFGNVIEVPYYPMGTMAPGYNAIGSVWAVAAPISLAGMTGFLGGMYLFQSDLVLGYDASTGNYSYAWKSENGNWQGDLTQLEPLHGYWVYIAPGHTGFNWLAYPQPLMTGNSYVGPQSFNPFNQGLTVPPAEMLPGSLPPTPASISGPATKAVSSQGGEQ